MARVMRALADDLEPKRHSVDHYLAGKREREPSPREAVASLQSELPITSAEAPAAAMATQELAGEASRDAGPQPVHEIEQPVRTRMIPIPPPARVPARVPAQPRQRLSDILAAFMAEKNIRWGEIIGGLLIVCSSAALVISLWSRIEAIPVLKFVIFTAMTAFIHGAGLFVYHRWKIPTTGHIVLLIATLLVPLNFLAFAAFSLHGRVAGGLTTPVEIAALVLFGWLSYRAARVVMPAMPRLFASGVVAISASSLVIPYFAPLTGGSLWGMAILPVVAFVGVMGVSFRRLARRRRIIEDDGKHLLLLLGMQMFACTVPFGLVAYESGLGGGGLRFLAPVMGALAGPAWFIGLFIWKRLPHGVATQMRTSAASVALGAVAIMLVAVGLSWPNPARLLATTVVVGLWMALACRITAHAAVRAAAAASFAVTWVLATHVYNGLSWTTTAASTVVHALVSARTGQALVGAVAACALYALLLDHRRRRGRARVHAGSAFALAAISVLLLTFYGFARPGDPEHVAWTYAAYAVIAFIAAFKARSSLLVWCGGILGQLALGQLLVYLWPVGEPAWPTALLVGVSANVAGIVTLRIAGVSDQAAQRSIKPLARLAVAISALATLWMIERLYEDSTGGFAVRMAWLSGLWLMLAVMMRWSPLLSAAQIAMAVAGCAGVYEWLERTPWFLKLAYPWASPRVLHAYALTIAGISLAWAIVRRVVEWRCARSTAGKGQAELRADDTANWAVVLHRLLKPDIPLADRWMSVVAVAALIALAAWSVLPGIEAEHGWRWVLMGAHHHIHAAGAGSWILLGMLLITLFLGHHEKARYTLPLGALIAVACATAFVAARFESEQQVVTILRWLPALIFLALTAVISTRKYWTAFAGQRIRGFVATCASNDMALIILCGLFAMPSIALTLTYGLAAGAGTAALPATLLPFGLRGRLLGPMVLVIAAWMAYGRSVRRPSFAAVTAVLTCTLATFVELCALQAGGLGLSYSYLIWIVQLTAIIAAAVALVWRLSLGWGNPEETAPRCPAWPLAVARCLVALVIAVAAASLLIRPGSVSAGVAAVGSIWGWLAVMLVELALEFASSRHWKLSAETARAVRVLFAAVLVASALASFDTGNWLCFHVLLVGLGVAGGLLLYVGARRTRELVGSGWQETFATISARAEGSLESVGHDVSCRACGYNLRGLASSGRCPECNTTIASSLEAVVERLSPEWAGNLRRTRTQVSANVLFCIGAATLFAVRAAIDDPQRPWWSTAVLAAVGGLCIALAAWSPRRIFAYIGGAEICLAASVWWITEFASRPLLFSLAGLSNLANINVIAMAAGGFTWFIVERRLKHVYPNGSDRKGHLPVPHHASAMVSCAAVVALAGIALWGAVTQQSTGGLATLQWFGWSAALALLIACRTDSTFRHGSAAFYGLGLAAVVTLLARAGLPTSTLAWAMSLALGGYVLAATMVLRRGGRSGPDASARAHDDAGLFTVNALMACSSVLLACYVNFSNPEWWVRIIVVVSPVLCALAALCTTSGRRELKQTVALGLLSAGVVLAAWSAVAPATPEFLLHRAIGALLAAAVIMVGSSVLKVVDQHGRWKEAIARNFAGTCVLAACAMLWCSSLEVGSLAWGPAIAWTTVPTVALIAALAILIVSSVVFAVHDRLDPLGVPESRKGIYVYVGEWLAGVLALHIRASMPWLFSGLLTQYWPMIIVGLAFAAIAAGEICGRRGLTVLARPLGRTGMFLPALGLVDVFVASSQVHFSIVLLTTGILYGVLAALRRSIRLGLLAAVSLNGSLWYLLYRNPGLGLTQHPQLWFIPLALAVLLAGHLNRARLKEEQRATLNYVGLLVVYLSSTADIFLIGVARAPWLPLVLMGFSLLGVLVGFVAQIRSFLLLGTSFLTLSLLTMVWHAAANLGWVWVWYVAGIALGAGIITIFAIFEKKRQEMNAWLQKVRGWAG
jgi:hypothetical protein